MAAPQTYKNHTRFDPAWHFFVMPILLINIILMVWLLFHWGPQHNHLHKWWIVLALGLFVLCGQVRGYAVKNQDRIIRLEERLRYATLLPAAELPLLQSLTLKQMIALRFASDAELPALALRAATENLTPKQIKESIQIWRPDIHRV
jgi:Family of unknown function (DUF6526)